MALDHKLALRQTHRLIMTPMLQQAIKLLPLPRLELINKIRQELTENPLLDEEVSTEQEAPEKSAEEDQNDSTDMDWDTYFQQTLYNGTYSQSDGLRERPPIENTLKKDISLWEHLIWQLNLSAKNDGEKYIGSIIVGNIDEDGYIRVSLEEIAGASNTTVEEVDKVLKLIQTFDPPGVAAKDMKESLLIQARSLDKKNPVAEEIIEHHLDHIEEKYYAKIAKELSVSKRDVAQAVKEIGELNPTPGSYFNPSEIQYITPDVIVIKGVDDYQIILNDDGIPRLTINTYYHEILRNSSDSTKAYLEEKFQSAIWLMKSIEQRRQTLYKVANSIVKFQKDFLDYGLTFLKPLVLKNVADDIEMHESTVSRVTSNKYIYTPQGLFELKFFFHKGVNSLFGEESLSSVRVKQLIKDMVEGEKPEKPLTDIQITSNLLSKNINIARRTVTKYRKELKILPASKRRRRY